MTDDRLPSLVRVGAALGRKPGVFPANVVKEDDRTRRQNFADMIEIMDVLVPRMPTVMEHKIYGAERFDYCREDASSLAEMTRYCFPISLLEQRGTG